MPELPEVETVRRGLNQLTLNQEIRGGDALLERAIAYPFSAADFFANLQGTAISQWDRRGKYLLAQLQQPAGKAAGWLGVHLRMTGQLLWLSPQEPLHKHARARLFFATEKELRFVDRRTFGKLWWVPPTVKPESIITGLQKLSPDPLTAEFDVKYLAEKLRHRRRSIKTALLDQAIAAGIGNIYADEALFLSGIRPQTLGSALRLEQIERLHASIIQVLQASIAAGGTTFSNFLNIEGVNGNYGGVAWVYNRAGQPCRTCAAPIERLKLGGRSSHFCPQCQQ